MNFLRTFYKNLFKSNSDEKNFVKAIDIAVFNDYICSTDIKCNIEYDPTLKSLPVGGVVDKEITKDRGFEKKTALFCANLILYINKIQKKNNVPNPKDLKHIINLYIESFLIGSIWVDPKYNVTYIIFGHKDEISDNKIFKYEQVVDPLVSNKLLEKIKEESIADQFYFNNNEIMVNKFFLEMYLQIKESIMCTLFDINPKTIVISGFGFGGALANLTASEVMLKFQNIHIYTFGSPKVGNPAFSKYMKYFRENRSIQQYFQIRNEDDIISQLPPSVSPNFENPKKPFFYQHSGAVVSIRQNWLSVEHNHFMPVYIYALRTLQYSVYFI